MENKFVELVNESTQVGTHRNKILDYLKNK